MEETMIFDSTQYCRFPVKELEEAYVMYLCGTLAHGKSSHSKPLIEVSEAKEASGSNDEVGLSSDAERADNVRTRTSSHGRSRRNTSSSGRRRKRTEGEDSNGFCGDAIDILSYDFAHHCKFFSADLETRYQMFLSGTLGEATSVTKTSTHRGGKIREHSDREWRNVAGGVVRQLRSAPTYRTHLQMRRRTPFRTFHSDRHNLHGARSQRSHERSSKSSEKSNRRLTPTEERKVSPTEFDDLDVDQRVGNRGRYRGKPRVSYQKTPYQGSRRCCGEFLCPRCYRHWTSANSRANKAQPCNVCGLFVYPHSQWPLSWPFFPDMVDPMTTWDDLEDQENRHVGNRMDDHYTEAVFDKEGMKLGGPSDRRPGYRSRRPLRPHHRRRREQDV